MLEMVYNLATTTALKLIDLLNNLVISYVKLVIKFVGANGLENHWAERNSWIRLDARAGGIIDIHV